MKFYVILQSVSHVCRQFLSTFITIVPRSHHLCLQKWAFWKKVVVPSILGLVMTHPQVSRFQRISTDCPRRSLFSKLLFSYRDKSRTVWGLIRRQRKVFSWNGCICLCSMQNRVRSSNNTRKHTTKLWGFAKKFLGHPELCTAKVQCTESAVPDIVCIVWQ